MHGLLKEVNIKGEEHVLLSAFSVIFSFLTPVEFSLKILMRKTKDGLVDDNTKRDLERTVGVHGRAFPKGSLLQ